MLDCGHPCYGTRGNECLPCLKEECAEKNGLAVNADEYCNICFVEGLGAAPCV